MPGSPPSRTDARPALQGAGAAALAVVPSIGAAGSMDAAPGRRLAMLCAVAVLVIWITFILVARGSARATLTPFDIAWLRFVFSGLVVLSLAWQFRHALARGLAVGLPNETGGRPALRRAVVLGLIGGVAYSGLAYSGFFLAPVAHAAVLMPGCLPLWSVIGAWLLLGERLTAPRVAGLALIGAGGVAVAGSSLLDAFGGQGTWRGDLLYLAAGISWATYGVLCRRWRVGALAATAAVALVSFSVAVPAYAVAVASGALTSHLAAAPWQEIVFQATYQGGLSMLVAGYAFTQVVAHYGPVRTTMFTAVVPPLAALAAVPLLGEPLAASALFGLACVTLGLLVGNGVIAWPRRVNSGLK